MHLTSFCQKTNNGCVSWTVNTQSYDYGGIQIWYTISFIGPLHLVQVATNQIVRPSPIVDRSLYTCSVMNCVSAPCGLRSRLRVMVTTDQHYRVYASRGPPPRGPRGAHIYVVGMLRLISDINQPSLPISFFFFILFFCLISVFVALSTVFNSINSPENSPFFHSVLPVLSLPYWFFKLHISLWKPPSALI